jgi:hypothetical protein
VLVGQRIGGNENTAEHHCADESRQRPADHGSSIANTLGSEIDL